MNAAPTREGEEPRRRRSRRDRQRDRRRAEAPAAPGAVQAGEGASTAGVEPGLETVAESAPAGQLDTAPTPVETHAFGVPPSEQIQVPETAAAEAAVPSTEVEPEPVAQLFAEATTIREAAEPIPSPEPVMHPETAAFAPSAPAPAAHSAEAPSTVAVDTRASLSEAGLELIETDPSKAASTRPEPEPVKLGRPRPERQKPVEEALVQVETHK